MPSLRAMSMSLVKWILISMSMSLSMSLSMLLPRTLTAADARPREDALVIRESIEIAASPARVWAVLVDVDAYEQWNPWLVRAGGRVEPGGAVWADVRLRGAIRRAHHRVQTVRAPHRLCWRDEGWFTDLAAGRRCRTISPIGEGRARLVQELTVTGPLRKTVARRFGPSLRAGLKAETEALARRAEAGVR